MIALYGTSRVAGGGVLARNKLWYQRPGFAGAPLIYNMGVDAFTMSGLASKPALLDGVYRAGVPVVYSFDDQINDLGGLGSSTNPMQIYLTLKSLRDYARGKGANVRVVFENTLPQDSGGIYGRSSADINTDRVTLNGYITSYAADVDAVANTASNPDMGTYPTSCADPTLYLDRLHPTPLGYSKVPSYGVAAINAAAAT